ncbi:MAG TPA: hypothetical protein VMW91_00460 [Desulfosporosinus sp.]|nr:hypothetical protein [Desulfosporosinus sp.]
MANKGSSAEHSALVNETLTLLGVRPDIRIWKNATGTSLSAAGSFIRFGLKGSADILGITSDGRFIAIECKTGNAKQSKFQRAFESMILKMGGRYILCRSADETLEKIKSLALPPVDFSAN